MINNFFCDGVLQSRMGLVRLVSVALASLEEVKANFFSLSKNNLSRSRRRSCLSSYCNISSSSLSVVPLPHIFTYGSFPDCPVPTNDLDGFWPSGPSNDQARQGNKKIRSGLMRPRDTFDFNLAVKKGVTNDRF
jgi:hypothetical protein